jgi:hypothetical protein
MMTVILIYLQLYYPFFVIIFLCLFVGYYTKKIQKLLYTPLQKDSFSIQEALQYLDKYRIKNKIYTFSMVLLYFFINILLIVFLRLLSLNKNQVDMKYPILYRDVALTVSDVFFLCVPVILFIVSFILIQWVLNLLFYTEVLKMHIYFYQKKSYFTIFHFIGQIHRNIITFFEILYLFIYNVSKLQVVSDEYEYETIHDQNVIYNHTFVVALSKYFVFIAKYFKPFLWFIILLKIICRWFYFNFRIYSFMPFIPSLVAFIFIFDAFITFKFNITNFAFFIIYSLSIFIKVLTFVVGQDYVLNGTLGRYFYENSYKYAQQFLNHNDIDYHFIERENLVSFIKTFKQEFVFYIFNDFNILYNCTEQPLLFNYLKTVYRQWLFIIINFIILSYIFINKNIIILKVLTINIPAVWFNFLIWLLLIYCNRNTFKRPKDGNEFTLTLYYTFQKTYKYFFWFLACIQVLILYFLYVKAHLYIYYDEVLWQSTAIEITCLYTIEEKLKFLYHYLDIAVKNNQLPFKIEALLTLLDLMDITEYINEQTTLKDIKAFLNTFLYDYSIASVYLDKENKQLEMLEEMTFITKIMNITSYYILGITVILHYKALNFIIYPHNIEFFNAIKLIVELSHKFRK